VDAIIETLGQLVTCVKTLSERKPHSVSPLVDQPVTKVRDSLEDFEALNGELKESTKKEYNREELINYNVYYFFYSVKQTFLQKYLLLKF
jgi:hypothetical protein